MFVIKQTSDYKWPVSFSLPSDDGRFNQYTFTAVFPRLSQTRIREFADKEMTDLEIAKEVLVGFSDIEDGNGKPLEFNEQNLRAVLDAPGVARATVLTFLDSVSGVKRKN